MRLRHVSLAVMLGASSAGVAACFTSDEGGAPVQIGSITLRGVPDSIALVPIPAQNAP